MVYAGFWRRVAAYLIDAVILALAVVLAGVVTMPAEFASPEAEAAWTTRLTWYAVIGQGLYFAGLESSAWQATVGKRLIGLRVTDYQGGRLGLGRAAVRYLGRLASELLLGLGFLMVAFTERKQGLHDFMARTYVLIGRPGA